MVRVKLRLVTNTMICVCYVSIDDIYEDLLRNNAGSWLYHVIIYVQRKLNAVFRQ